MDPVQADELLHPDDQNLLTLAAEMGLIIIVSDVFKETPIVAPALADESAQTLRQPT